MEGKQYDLKTTELNKLNLYWHFRRMNGLRITTEQFLQREDDNQTKKEQTEN